MKKSLLRLGAFAVLLASFASCQKLGPLEPEYFTVNPNPLEVKAGKVEGTITATFPEKYFAEKATIEVTPVLKYEGGEATSEPAFYQGTKVDGNDTEIQYKAGGTVTQNFSFDYVPAMKQSTLWLRFKATLKDKPVDIPEIQIAVGCIATSTLADASKIAPAYAKDAFVRDTKEVTEADIMFQIQRSDVKGNDDVKALNAAAAAVDKDEKLSIEGLTLVAAASPDGDEALNEKLASARQNNTVNFLKKQKNQTAVDAKYIAEDWDGFQKLVQESSVKDKDLILRVLGTYQDAEQREKEIKNLSAAYKELADEILPKLRRSHLTLTVIRAGLTDEELLEIAKNNPDSLNVEQLMYAASISKSKEEADAMTAANAQQNPEDWRTQNNLGASKFEGANVADAKTSLDAAIEKGGAEASEPNFNLALISLVNGDAKSAEGYLGKVQGVENKADAQTVMYIQQGEYGKAVAASGAVTSNNAALAQLLVGNNDKAADILDKVESKDATTYYLAAIAATRQGNADKAVESLAKSIELDAAKKDEAKKDLEFLQLLASPKFVELMK
ncbi:MAG: hypothetical protein J6Y87_08330 [Muribaculaceae bacterium]|nr:hypothetical protein [Muribaculaceae bacterium]